ncbi:MAG: hypothetical protein PF541_01445 [Prolixibacteraceae bacterium]|nr:hypothetical protein [Prolixibacteraceae bacterium]
MILNYKTEKLPLHFISLGVMLLPIGIWRIIVLDWRGIFFFLLSLPLLFLRSGITIDTQNKKLRKYIGFFVIKIGNWEDIKSITNLQIIETRETHNMHVLSLSRNETNVVFMLIMTLQNKNIELMKGEKDFIIKKAKEISKSLKTDVINNS